MSANSIDERVVDMKFNNALFESNISKTLASLDALKQKLNFGSSAKALDELGTAGKRFDLSNMSNGVQSLVNKFSELGFVGIAAITNITNKAVDAGLRLTKALTIGPIGEGYADYGRKLTSVQTIMNATGKSIQRVSADFSVLDTYADKTIYNLNDMTSAFAKFTNAGVDSSKSVPAIKGIANMVALAGQDANAASIAMYNLSQSIAGGFLTTTDYRSLNLANVATKEWKDQMIQGAVAAGTLKKNSKGLYEIKGTKKAVTEAALFNQELSTGWASTKVLLKVLGDYGDTNTAIGKKAQSAAQDVKSFSMMMDTLSAAVGTTWTDTFQIVIGDLNESKKLFTGLTTTISNLLDTMNNARNNLLQGWKDLGGRTALIEGLSNAFKGLSAILKPIGEAFSEVFPPMTAERLYNITDSFRALMRNLTPTADELVNIKRTAKGFFSILDIGWQIIKGVGGVIGDLFSYLQQGSGGFLEFTGNIGDFFTNIDTAIKNGDGLTGFFDALTEALKKPIDWAVTLGSGIAKLFSGIDEIDFEGMGQRIKDFFSPLESVSAQSLNGWDMLVAGLQAMWTTFEPLATKIAEGWRWFSDQVRQAIMSLSMDNVKDAGQIAGMGILGAIGVSIKKLIDSFSGVVGKFSDIGSSITGVLGGLEKYLTAMQQNVKAGMILKIAAAIGLLAVSALLLSTIDSSNLATVLIAMTFMLKGLMVGLSEFDKFNSLKSSIKMNLIAASLLGLAAAMVILSVALKIMSSMSWEELARGLLGMGAGLAIIGSTMRLMPKDMEKRTAGLIGLSVAIGILAVALKIMGSMSWEELGRGLTGLAGALITVVGAMNIMPKDLEKRSAGLIAIGIAMNIIAGAIAIMGNLSWDSLAKGLVGMAGALLIIAGAMKIMPKDMGKQSLALIAVSVALNIIAAALTNLGGMTWGGIAKGLIAIAGALIIIARATAAMSKSLAGAAAIFVVAAALAMLAPVIQAFGNMSLEQIGLSLLMLAGVFVVLGLAGLALTPVAPTLLLIGAAIALLGAGVMLAGVGLLAFAAGLTALSGASVIGTAALVTMVTAIIGLIPMIATQIGLGLVAILNVIAQNGQAFIGAGVALLTSLITAIGIVAPLAVNTLFDLIMLLVNKLSENVPKFVSAGMKMINGILTGIRDHIRETVKVAIEIIAEFINGIADGLPKITESGANLIISFLNSIADTIRGRSKEIGAAGGNIATALIEGMSNGILGGIGSIAEAATRMANAAIDTIKRVLGIHSPSKVLTEIGKFAGEGFYYGLLGMQAPVADAVTQIVDDMKEKLKTAITDSNADIKSLSAKLKKQQKDKKKSKKDKAAIKQTKADLAAAKDTNAKATAAQAALDKALAANQARLTELSANYDTVSEQLTNAKNDLQSAKDALNNAAASYKSQFNSTPEFADTGDVINTYIDDLKAQIEAEQKLNESLIALRNMGLDDTTYKKLVDKGVAAQPFIDALLESGQAGVDEIKNLDKQLDDISTTLGDNSATALYQAGVDAAQGLVNGLQANADAIAAEMVSIADAMVKAIKDKLGIKSPSRVLFGVGGYAVSGFLNGLQTQLPQVAKSAENIGDTAIDALRKTMSDVGTLATSEMNMEPVIRPVLDLSAIQKDSALLDTIFGDKNLGVDTSYNRASILSQEDRAAQSAQSGSTVNESSVSFVQNNYSPKALSPAEIYRQTKNGISTIRKVVEPV